MSNEVLQGSIEAMPQGGTICTGAGVDVFKLIALRSALGMFKAGLKFRGMTATQALAMASEYTGRKFKRGQFDEARAALTEAADAMRARLSDVNTR